MNGRETVLKTLFFFLTNPTRKPYEGVINHPAILYLRREVFLIYKVHLLYSGVSDARLACSHGNHDVTYSNNSIQISPICFQNVTEEKKGSTRYRKVELSD